VVKLKHLTLAALLVGLAFAASGTRAEEINNHLSLQ